MDSSIDFLRVWGINASCFGIVTLVELELWLKVVMLIVTIIYTGFKIVALLKEQK